MIYRIIPLLWDIYVYMYLCVCVCVLSLSCFTIKEVIQWSLTVFYHSIPHLGGWLSTWLYVKYSSLIYPGQTPPSPLYKWRYNRDSLALQLSRVEAHFLFLCVWAALGLPQKPQKDGLYLHYLNHRIPMRKLLEILGKPLIRLWEHMEKRRRHLSFGIFYKISWLKKMKSTHMPY